LGEILKLCVTGGNHLIELFQQSVQAGAIKDFKYFIPLIMNALAVKRAVIEMDEFEQNIRKALNYGHTLGHVIEAMTEYAIPHGIAVVIGMMIVNQMSCEQGLLAHEDCHAINHLCATLIDEASHQLLKKLNIQDMMLRLQQDKKVSGNHVTMVMLNSPGCMSFVNQPMTPALQQLIASSLGHLGLVTTTAEA
jgi:3-dehydroquinate synthase